MLTGWIFGNSTIMETELKNLEWDILNLALLINLKIKKERRTSHI